MAALRARADQERAELLRLRLHEAQRAEVEAAATMQHRPDADSPDVAAATAALERTRLAPCAPAIAAAAAAPSTVWSASPYTPPAATLSTAPLITPSPAVAAPLYPAGSLACFGEAGTAGSRMLEAAFAMGPGAMPNPAAVPAGVFLFEFPSRSLSAHVATTLAAPEHPLPVFARGAGSEKFRPPPAWGAAGEEEESVRPRCAGNCGDNSSRYLWAGEGGGGTGAVSSDVWTGAHVAPGPDELLYDAPGGPDPLCTPLHPFQAPPGAGVPNPNYPPLHPSAPDWHFA